MLKVHLICEIQIWIFKIQFRTPKLNSKTDFFLIAIRLQHCFLINRSYNSLDHRIYSEQEQSNGEIQF